MHHGGTPVRLLSDKDGVLCTYRHMTVTTRTKKTESCICKIHFVYFNYKIIHNKLTSTELYVDLSYDFFVLQIDTKSVKILVNTCI